MLVACGERRVRNAGQRGAARSAAQRGAVRRGAALRVQPAAHSVHLAACSAQRAAGSVVQYLAARGITARFAQLLHPQAHGEEPAAERSALNIARAEVPGEPIAVHYVQGLQSQCNSFHCTTLHCTALHCIALHCTALHCTALHCIALHNIALHWIALHCTALHCTALHCTAPVSYTHLTLPTICSV